MSSHQLVQQAEQNDEFPIIPRDAEEGTPNSGTGGQPTSLAEHSLMEIQKRIFDVSLLVQKQSAASSRADRYKQAYLVENSKVRKTVEAYNALGLEHENLHRENTRYKQHLIPEYDRLLQTREEEMQKNLRDFEFRNVELESKIAELEKQKCEIKADYENALSNGIECIQSQNQMIDELELRNRELTAIDHQSSGQLQSPIGGKRRRSSEIDCELSSEERAEPERKSRTRRQPKRKD